MNSLLDSILEWMQTNNLRLCSFERIVASVSGASTFEQVAAEVRANPGIFRTANIKGVGPGLALVDTFRFPDPVPSTPIQVQDLTSPAIPTPVGYASPAVADPNPNGYVAYAVNTEDNTAPVPTPVVNAREFTPRETVVKLLNLAATADVSGSALNYANAAVAAATAVQLLQNANE